MVIQRLRPLFSGQGVQVEVLSAELASRGIKTTILTAGHGRNPRWETINGYRVRRLRADVPLVSSWFRRGRFRSEIFGIRALLWFLWRGWRTQIVHAHTLSDALYTTWLFSRLRRIPLIFEMTLLGTDDAHSFATNPLRFSRLRNAIFRRCDGYVAISPALARVYEDAGLPKEKLRLIPQGVDTDRFCPADDRPAIRERLQLPVTGPLLVFVGSLIERKGIDVLLAAWETTHARVPDATLVLVGVNRFDDDPAAAEFLGVGLAALSDGARRRVVQSGVRNDVDQYLRAADLFVFPSRREGFGTVMIEAMACGIPCIVAELPDITDFIFDTEEISGVIVPQEDTEALAAEVVRLLEDPQLARRIGEAGRRRAVGRFSVSSVVDDYLDFYAALTAPRGGR